MLRASMTTRYGNAAELGFAYHFATRVVFLHDGLIHEQGTPEASAEKP